MSFKLNLYLLEQSDNEGYDTYNSMVVCAPDAYTAVRMHPRTVRDCEKGVYVSLDYHEGEGWFDPFRNWDGAWNPRNTEWANTHETVKCTFIGFATKSIKSVVEFDDEEGVVISSYNAG